MKLYAIAVVAMQVIAGDPIGSMNLSSSQYAGSLFAESAEAAEAGATREGLNVFPESAGYFGHSVVVHEVESHKIMRAWLNAQADESATSETANAEGLLM